MLFFILNRLSINSRNIAFLSKRFKLVNSLPLNFFNLANGRQTSFLGCEEKSRIIEIWIGRNGLFLKKKWIISLCFKYINEIFYLKL